MFSIKFSLSSCCFLCLATLLCCTSACKSKNDPKPNGGKTGDPTTDFLSITRDALAATENVLPKEADQLWAKLVAEYPSDKSVSLNSALNRVLLVDQLATTAENPTVTEQERTDARAQLSDAIANARAAITNHEKVSGDVVESNWMGRLIDLREADMLPKAMRKSIRRNVINKLAKLLESPTGKDPRSVILIGPLEEAVSQMEDPFNGIPIDIARQAAKTFGAVSKQHSDNLFLAIRAAQLNLATKDDSTAEHVNRSWGPAKAIRSTLQKRLTAGVTPEQLVQQVAEGAEKNDWNTADLNMMQWFNIVNPEEIMKTDRRRVAPHPLDRLSFDGLRRLAVKQMKTEPIQKASVKYDFVASQVGGEDLVAIELLDYDLDLSPDVLTAAKDGTVALWKFDQGKFSKVTELKSELMPTELLTVDLFEADASNPDRIKKPAGKGVPGTRHDAFPGVLAYSSKGVQLISVDGRDGAENILTLASQDTGLSKVDDITTVAAGDLEGDGDLDLMIATTEGLRLFVNRGDRSFFEIEHEATFADQGKITAMQIGDIDRDLDLDAVVLHGESGQISILENLLHLQFRSRVLDEVKPLKDAGSVHIGDFDGNVSWDIAVVSPKQTTIVFSQTADTGIWTIERQESSDFASSHTIISDLDNDSWQEIVSDTTGNVSRLGPWGIDEPQSVSSLTGITSLLSADFDSDGGADIVGIKNGQLAFASNQLKSKNHYVGVRFKGIYDNATGRVNHYAIGSVLEVRFGPHYRSQIVTRPMTHFGLASYKSPGSIRVIMPNGLTQTIRDAKVDMLVEEEQSLKGSCPYLYAWDGEKFVFMTDCLWAAPLGLQVAPGIVVKDRPWEYLKVDGANVKPRDGNYEMRITEELWEIAYIDHVALQAVDHPADVQIWTNEKVGPGNIAEPTIFAFRNSDVFDVNNATDTQGKNVSELLKTRDGQFVQAFEQRMRQGLCPPHWIDLDFSDSIQRIQQGKSIHLVLTGWIMPTDTSLNIQIDQNPQLPSPEYPSIWVPEADEEGGWKKVIPYAGFPGGKTKTIVIDVTDQILRDDPRLRVRTSAQIYWDDAHLAVQDEPAPFKAHDSKLNFAETGHHGFSAKSKPNATSPEIYDYQSASSFAKWPPLAGPLTSFGESLGLVKAWDDKMVVISSGDELRLKFTVPSEPIPQGWKRDFVLHCVGWDKDADLNTLTGQSTLPLPAKDMQQFPPTLADAEAAKGVMEKNAKRLTRQQSFREFWRR